jgi:hypothetical protein
MCGIGDLVLRVLWWGHQAIRDVVEGIDFGDFWRIMIILELIVVVHTCFSFESITCNVFSQNLIPATANVHWSYCRNLIWWQEFFCRGKLINRNCSYLSSHKGPLRNGDGHTENRQTRQTNQIRNRAVNTLTIQTSIPPHRRRRLHHNSASLSCSVWFSYPLSSSPMTLFDIFLFLSGFVYLAI